MWSIAASSDATTRTDRINKTAIRFRYYKNSNRLIAFADEPLVIENNALGYIISYQLEDFEINFGKGSLFFVGFPLVQELENDRKGVQGKWERKRLKAYMGSVMHFMRSVYGNQLQQEGFDVRRMIKEPNLEKTRVKAYVDSKQKYRVNAVNGQITIEANDEQGNLSKDSLSYYRKVLAQDDFIEIYGQQLLPADSLIENSTGTDKVLFFDNYLYITYKNETEEIGFIRSQFQARRPSYQRSYIRLLNGNALSVDVNGNYYNPLDLFTMGYWGWSEKMADYLPLDYKAGKE